jgi:methylenetetrahydrofolate dehydrogenase (NADP+)/methenyltetrahydrofolate cyclohydrolase
VASLLDGKALAKRVQAELVDKIAALSRKPGLAVVLVGADPASQIYVRRKGEAAQQLGILHRQIDRPATTSEAEILDIVRELNEDPAIDGILVQLPLPKGVDANRVMDAIDPSKDVDGFTSISIGRLSQGKSTLVACTPAGVMRLLRDAGVELSGKEAVVLGRSNIVGRPMAMLLEQANATVTICHSRTADIEGHCRRADVLVAAIGRAELVRGDWVKPGAVVVDVGMNRNDAGKLCGDVEFAAAAERASLITPVPGGVGPMTIAMLMENTYEAAKRRG